MSEKYIYSFGGNKTEGSAGMKDFLGGKGANLAEMCLLKLPVPPGFTISTDACRYYYDHDKNFPPSLLKEVNHHLSEVEKFLGKKLGDKKNPLLLSVRSGARESMPGMMDTILNLGLNDSVVEGLADLTGNEFFAYDSYRRFIQMYANVVYSVSSHYFEDFLDIIKQDSGVNHDSDLSADEMKEIVVEFKKIFQKHTGNEFPQDAHSQLMDSIRAVLDSWMCSRAITYRKLNGISAEWGTAANIQSMVFGNMGNDSATGVMFTRDPSTGDKVLYGEYLINAQGEDVVAGIRTPYPISDKKNNESEDSMERKLPGLFKELKLVSGQLELHYKDMQDIEFTVEKGKLWILQTRSGKRTTKAALKIAVDLWKEKILSKEEALLQVNPSSLNHLLHATLDPSAEKQIFSTGLPASPGAASGIVVFSADDAEKMSHLGERVMLVRIETSPEDIHGMHVAEGILTSRGGMTSHAAVVARGMGKPCVVGASGLSIDYGAKTISVGGKKIKEGEQITIDGASGEIMLGKVATIQPKQSEDFHTIIKWADQIKKLNIRANAETVNDIECALGFGADGIGLCRTEHMFFEEERIVPVRKMIIAKSVEERKSALKEILPIQKQDFINIFSLMKEKPVNIRLLDMPLHEFLPHDEHEMKQVAKSLNVDFALVEERCKHLHEVNPMLGHRGSRLGITYPEIYDMQVRSIIEAMVHVKDDLGVKANVEIMVPLIATAQEMKLLRNLITKVASSIEKESGHKLQYHIGTMIELPRAALCSDKIAEHAEYMSYGTNDLSQTTFGLSRDDSAGFIQEYIEKGILAVDPFCSLDQDGVGELIKISAERARSKAPDIKLGICGEHGGDPNSIKFFHDLGFNYVSCSPYRIHIARLAAAQAVLITGGF